MKVAEVIKRAKSLERGQTIEWEFKKGSYTNEDDKAKGDFIFCANHRSIYYAFQTSKLVCDFKATEILLEDMTDADWKYIHTTLRRKAKAMYGGNLFAYDENKRETMFD